MGHSLCTVPTQSYRWTITALCSSLFVGWCQRTAAYPSHSFAPHCWRCCFVLCSMAYSNARCDAIAILCCSAWLEWLNHFVPCKLKSVEFCCCYCQLPIQMADLEVCCFLLPLLRCCLVVDVVADTVRFDLQIQFLMRLWSPHRPNSK